MREKLRGSRRSPTAHKSILPGRSEIARYLRFLALFLTPLAQAANPFELIPREDPLSPEDSLAAFEIDGDYRLRAASHRSG